MRIVPWLVVAVLVLTGWRMYTRRDIERPAGVLVAADPVQREIESGSAIDLGASAKAVNAEIAPLDKSYWRTAAGLEASSARLDALWKRLNNAVPAVGAERLRAREVAAVTASARWTVTAALARTESRGVHRRRDYPQEEDVQATRIIVSGLDRVTATRLGLLPQAPLVPDYETQYLNGEECGPVCDQGDEVVETVAAANPNPNS